MVGQFRRTHLMCRAPHACRDLLARHHPERRKVRAPPVAVPANDRGKIVLIDLVPPLTRVRSDALLVTEQLSVRYAIVGAH